MPFVSSNRLIHAYCRSAHIISAGGAFINYSPIMGGSYARFADGNLLWTKSDHAYQQERLHTTVWTSNKIGALFIHYSDFPSSSAYFSYCPTKSTSNSASECGKLHRRAVPRWWKGAAFKLNVKQLAHSNHCFMLEKVVSQLVATVTHSFNVLVRAHPESVSSRS